MTTQTQIEALPAAGHKAHPGTSELESQLIERIRQYMAEKEWTQFRLSRASGVSQSIIQQVLSGKKRPSPAALAKLASATRLTTGDLVDIVATETEAQLAL